MAATAAANTTTFLVLTFFLVHLTLLNSHPHKFHRFLCDDWGIIGFPFSQNLTKYVDRCETNYFAKTIEFTNEVQHYKFVNLSSSDNIKIMPYVLEILKDKENCEAFNNFTLASSSSISSFSLVVKDISIIKCNSGSKHRDVNDHCHGSILFYNKLSRETDDVPKRQGCLFAQWPVNKMTDSNPLPYGSYEYNRSLHVSEDCGKRGSKTKVIIASVVPGVFIIIICILGFIIWRRNKWRNHPYFLSRRMSSHLSTSTRDQEGGTGYLGVPVFSYKVLEEATNNFHPSKILGDGGFGTVYHGILRDGRQVAVKHLYENNCKRVEQFVNEIEIIKRLRHKNLVVLYGCTSRRSSELLLVYEYVPNGTLADHLHGDRANSVFLMWHIRMNIAIETATALSYLHACDIIHRDVKTNNILLGNHFCVKVADFGLSRSFPIGASHVSTAPQGTPGYVDPEYHQCYQLTDRSDVYSFGVVLIELVSSLPAVDITRHRHEINLANLAIDRIQRSAFNELIDPRLGYEKDLLIERMTTSVAELAFQCLQYDKEMRPSMDEVLNSLKGIQDYEFEDERSMGAPPSPEFESDRLVKVVKFQSSPDVVTDKWVDSASTTPSASG